jgi:hypothetical protein
MTRAAARKQMPIRSSEILPVGPGELSNPKSLARICQDLERTYYWSDCWQPEFYIALAEAGFISTAMAYADPPFLLLPELQESYAVLDWENLRMDRSVARLLEDPVVSASVCFGFSEKVTPVLDCVVASHGHCWIHPPYRDLLNRLEAFDHPRFRLRSVEVRENSSGTMVAGELGYTIGSTYTSLTGFFCRADRKWNHYGKLQLVMLAQALRDAGYAFWNLGHPYMAYKTALGARILPRHEFLNRWRVAIAELPGAKSGSGLPRAVPGRCSQRV